MAKPGRLARTNWSASSSFLERDKKCAGFVSRFPVLGGRARVVYDSSPRLHAQAPSRLKQGANHDAHLHIAVAIKITDCSCIGTAPCGFERIDDFHCPHLGRTGNHRSEEHTSE